MILARPIARELAQDQWGLVTRRQLTDAGVGPKAVERLTDPGGTLERVAWGVYQLAGAPVPDHRELRAAWLQLAPDVPAWERVPAQGVASHRSAADLYGLGNLSADQHEFTVAVRRQARRADVRIHVRPVGDDEWTYVRGLPATKPSRIAADLIRADEDPEAVAQIITDAIGRGYGDPAEFPGPLASYATSLGFRRNEGMSVFRWLLDLAGDPARSLWLDQAREPRTARRADGRPR